jgi:RimJ/RimL family protein N-acetyltransferase
MSTSLADWKGAPAPSVQTIEGRFIRLEKLDPSRHAEGLWKALQGPGSDPKLWDYLPYVPAQGRIEIGHVTFGAPMQRSPKSTEAVYLLAKESFALGYRRLEWKCNNGNARSKYAAERLGFSFEGVFRQHMVVKGQNRDTAWYSILDSEWPAIGAGFEQWLSDENQTESGQVKTLVECRG